jgi:hypothetical protein
MDKSKKQLLQIITHHRRNPPDFNASLLLRNTTDHLMLSDHYGFQAPIRSEFCVTRPENEYKSTHT